MTRADPFSAPSATAKRTFTSSDQHYRWELDPAGVVFDLDRVRRSSHELWGELGVRLTNGHFPAAKTYADGTLSVGDVNLSSVQARSTRAKMLAERSGGSLDWHGLLEEFATKVITAERTGESVIALRDVPIPPDTQSLWSIDGFPLLINDPMVLFGDPSTGKSYIAIWCATVLASRGIPVLYVDWEGSRDAQRKRFERLAQPMPELVYYLRRDRPLVRILDGVLQIIRDKRIRYVICDSIGFAVDGSPLDSEPATQYFGSARRFGCGSLHLAHSPKHVGEGQQATIFGSQFFKAGARSAWFIDRASHNPDDEIRVGLYHRKYNDGKEHAPLNYRIAFRPGRTTIEAMKAEDVEELARNLPVPDRMEAAVEARPLTARQLASDLDVTPNIIRAMLSRHKDRFIRIGDKIATAKTKRVEW